MIVFLLLCCLSAPCLAAELRWESIPGGRRAAVHPAPRPKNSGFTLLTPTQTGVLFTNSLSAERAQQAQNLMNGAGVAAGDVNGDGLIDLYFCNRGGANGLFINRGNGTFTDLTSQANAACTNQISSGCLLGDVDGDGDLDLLVSSFDGPNALLLNDGKGGFSPSPFAAAITTQQGASSMALGDLNGDGLLDLYLCHFATTAILRDGAMVSVRTVNGRPTVTGRFASRLKIVDGLMYEYGEPDGVFLNKGAGEFQKIAWQQMFRDESGNPMPAPQDFGLAVQIRDINGDGLPDIYVCNDFQTPDRLWLNQGKGIFQAAERSATRNMSYASMGVDFADINRDGLDDFITVEMLSHDPIHRLRQSSARISLKRVPGSSKEREETTRNNLFLNRGDGTYADVALMAGVAATDWSWTPIFLDVDLDGFEDLLVSNGHMHDVNDRDVAESLPRQAGQVVSSTKSALGRYPALNPPKFAFRNRGNGTFAEAPEWGFDTRVIGHGMCLADIDNDGDLDVIINTLNEAPVIYRNDCTAPRIGVRLRGRPPNTRGIGAKIKVLGGPVVQTQEMICGGRYLSSDDPMRVFAAFSLTNRLEVQVQWPDGSRSHIQNAEPNSIYEIDQPPSSKPESPKAPESPASSWFAELRLPEAAAHTDEFFDDFAQQPLLPWKLSQSGPGLLWIDGTSTNSAALVLGAGRGHPLKLLTELKSSTGVRVTPSGEPAQDDLTGLAFWSNADGDTLFTGQARYENTQAKGGVHILRRKPGDAGFEAVAAAEIQEGVGGLAAADLNGMGKVVLFAAGNVLPQHYPEHTTNRIYRFDEGRLIPDAAATAAIASAGLVRGAVWTDLDGDGLPELVLAEEWGPIRVFQNQAGSLKEMTETWGLSKLEGLWTGITAGDFDGDGAMDLAVGNAGLNTSYQAWPAQEHQLIYADFTGIGTLQLIETTSFAGRAFPTPWRSLDTLAAGFPGIREHIKSHREFAEARVSDWLKNWNVTPKTLKATTFESLVLLNRGGRFEPMALPGEAQQAPVFGLTVGDVDGDGVEDLFLAQNFFAVRPEDSRMDAGRGLWLRGRGDGHFSAVPGQTSGIKVYGEQRGCALADFDQDGRVDLAIGQNGEAVRIFQNTGAKPGWCVKLEGPAHNRHAFGAVLRVITAGRRGPARELHAGSGWYSQDSAAPVLGFTDAGAKLEVRWPGGKTTVHDLPTKPSTTQIRGPGAE